MTRSFKLTLLFLSVLCSSALVQTSELVGLPPDPDARPDFSGKWEKDYRRSDDWETKVNLKIMEMRRQAERQARARGEASFGGGAVTTSQRNSTNIIDLARFAELISRSNDLYITQTDSEVRIKRDGEADLICGTGQLPIVSDSQEFGYEVCGWNQHQLIFKVVLPGEIGIYYQFVVSPDRQSINLLTRVSSGQSLAFDLVQFFNRYETSSEPFKCTQTLTKGKVCSQREGLEVEAAR